MKQFLLALICFPVFLAAQSSWVTDLPVTGTNSNASLFIVNDNVYVYTSMPDTTETSFQKQQLAFYKLDLEGTLIDSTTYDFDITTPWVFNGGPRIGQTKRYQNDSFIVMGEIWDDTGINSFFMEVDDMLNNINFNSIYGYRGINVLLNVNGNIIFRGQNTVEDLNGIYYYNSGFNFVDPLVEGSFFELVENSHTSFIAVEVEEGKWSVNEYNIDGSLTENLFEYQDRIEQVEFLEEDNFLVYTQEDVYCYDENLLVKWIRPHDSISPSESFFDFKINEIQATSDGGFVMIGYLNLFIGNPESNIVFVAKVDASGEREWWYAYDLPLNNGLQIEEVENGYVCLGSDALTLGMKVFKILEDGELTNAENLEASILDILAFPNPVGASGQAHLQFGTPYTGTVRLYDLNSRLLQTYQLEYATQHTISILDLPEGMYIIQGQNPKTQELWSKKIIK